MRCGGWRTCSWGLGLASSLLAGCINTEFGCKGFPEGASCQAVSQVLALDPSETGGYLSAEGGRRGAGASAGAPNDAAPQASDRSRAAAGEIPVQLGTPILRAPEVLRVWLAPWTDEQDRLHEASYVYVQAAPPEWAYTGPRRAGKRLDRLGTSVVPRPPAGLGTGAAQPGGASAGRPAPAAAGVLPPGSAARPASAPGGKAAGTGAGTGQASAGPSGQVLMVPTPQGGQRPLVIPSIAARGGSAGGSD